jgi:hypothetical protein
MTNTQSGDRNDEVETIPIFLAEMTASIQAGKTANSNQNLKIRRFEGPLSEISVWLSTKLSRTAGCKQNI